VNDRGYEDIVLDMVEESESEVLPFVEGFSFVLPLNQNQTLSSSKHSQQNFKMLFLKIQKYVTNKSREVKRKGLVYVPSSVTVSGELDRSEMSNELTIWKTNITTELKSSTHLP
jgi:hypothetical protein